MENKEKLKKILLSKIMIGGNLAKWLPRPNNKNAVKRANAHIVRKSLGMNPKDFRKMLAEYSNTVEQAMCSKDWSRIEYSKVPSKAMSDYMKAFGRNDAERFGQYLKSLEKGETKINASAVYPYDIVKNMRYGSSRGADAQWNALPNYMEGSNERLLPVVDSSGSMTCFKIAGNDNLSCYDISLSLGMYISERNVGAFKDAFITFSETPKLQVLKGSLSERYSQIKQENARNTNVQKVFELILNKAITNSVPESEMPTMIIILSDMQFDEGTGNSYNDTVQELIERKYSEAGYKVPKVVYWNLNSSETKSPVKFNKQGCALVSGFNVNILTNILSGKDMTPESMMLKVINSERYSQIKI